MQSLLRRVAEALDRVGIDYVIVGGQAVLVYGEPRLTRDIDITLLASPDDLDRVMRIIKNLKLNVLVDDVESFIRKTWVLPTYDPESGFRVDFIFSWTPFEREAVKRAVLKNVEDYPVKFISPEDLIVMKLVAGRPRDIEDVKGILRRIDVDVDYIINWLEEFSSVIERDLVSEFYKLLKSYKR